MPKIDVYDIEGKKVKTIELKEEVFGIEPNEAVVHSVLVNYLIKDKVHKVLKQEQKYLVVVENHGDKKVQVEQDKEAFVHHIG